MKALITSILMTVAMLNTNAAIAEKTGIVEKSKIFLNIGMYITVGGKCVDLGYLPRNFVEKSNAIEKIIMDSTEAGLLADRQEKMFLSGKIFGNSKSIKINFDACDKSNEMIGELYLLRKHLIQALDIM